MNGFASCKQLTESQLKLASLDTPLGSMIVVADDELLYLLEFVDRKGLEREVKHLSGRTKLDIVQGSTAITALIEEELRLYFAKQLTRFTTPLFLLGSDFQKSVWAALQETPLGETRSYAALATSLNKPTAFRAVANANGANQIAIVIPCHRVINSNGNLGGYGGGVPKKQWLLEHERNYKLG
jgi:AraC family transcriptional regulator of adaptative response/methylated-DNA-[protein]-cysteine methyltransferase